MRSPLLPAPLTGVLTVLCMALVLAGITLLLTPGIVLKALIPLPAWRRLCTRYLVGVADLWSALNHRVYHLLQDVRWQLSIDGAIDPSRSYLLVCNHQSWADILVLCDLLSGRSRFPRFFLKQQLIWVPIIGITCWALDMPFMKRHSREALARNPALRGDDLRATRAFCEKYRNEPITAINFLEGTRFTPGKHAGGASPYQHLLRPKSAGLAFMLSAMGEQFAGLIDVSIAYQPVAGSSLVWSWLCGRQPTLVAQAVVRPIPVDLLGGDYAGDDAFRGRFQAWVNTLWERKDQQLGRLKIQVAAQASAPETRTRNG